jgi:tripartite-type tricarboxylate transporter receptor subunit TctC
MAPDIVKRLNAAFIRAMAAPEVHQRLLEGGLDPIVGTPEAFGEFIRAEIVKWSKVAKEVGARVE